MKNTATLPIFIAFAIPVLLILGIVLSTTLSQNRISPTQNFLYSNESDYDYRGSVGRYTVKNNQLQDPVEPTLHTGGGASIAIPQPPGLDTPVNPRKPTLYLYNSKTDISHKISDEDAKKLSLSDQPYSVDGYTVSNVQEHSEWGLLPSLFFGGGYSNYVYIKKGDARKKINLVGGNGSSYSYNFHLIGWVQ